MRSITISKPGKQRHEVRQDEELVIVMVVTGSGEWEVEVSLVGNGSRCQVLAVFSGRGVDKQVVKVVTEHVGERTEGVTKVRGVLKDQAMMDFDGMIKVSKTGQKTNSYLEEKVILMSEMAHHEARPQLEIEADEVKASHASTTSKLSEEHLFYLMSRGVGREVAEKMLVTGFMVDVYKGLSDKELRGYIMGEIGKLV